MQQATFLFFLQKCYLWTENLRRKSLRFVWLKLVLLLKIDCNKTYPLFNTFCVCRDAARHVSMSGIANPFNGDAGRGKKNPRPEIHQASDDYSCIKSNTVKCNQLRHWR